MTKAEATERVQEVRDLILDEYSTYSVSDTDDILAYELGLEPDYIFDVLGI
jgi:hypothetical protein